MLVGNGVEAMVDEYDDWVPTPAVSLAIITWNNDAAHRAAGETADGIVVTPSHNPPSDGGFKYNPPHGGPADSDATSWIADPCERDHRRRHARREDGRAERGPDV